MATLPDAADEVRLHAQERAFRRNLFIVGGVHLTILAAFFFLSKWQPKPRQTELMWLDGGAFAGGDAEEPHAENGEEENEPEHETAPAIEPRAAPEPIVRPEPIPALSAPQTQSEIVLPATPQPTPVRATPKPRTPKPGTPKIETPKAETPKPKATPKAAAKATPKTKPNIASPTKPKETPNKTSSPKADSQPATATSRKMATETKSGNGGSTVGLTTPKGAAGSSAGAGKGAGKVGGGTGTGTNEFAWYYQMLDDRFTSRWEQPLSIVRSSQQFVTTLKIRINKDGTIVAREIANPSGNPVMDESVLAAARKVEMVDPLPAGLGADTFDVNINFALDQGP